MGISWFANVSQVSYTLVDKPLSLTKSLMSRKANVFSKISQVSFRAGSKELTEVINFPYFLFIWREQNHLITLMNPWFKGYPFVHL